MNLMLQTNFEARISESANKTSEEENTKNADQYLLILIAKKFDNESYRNKKKNRQKQ